MGDPQAVRQHYGVEALQARIDAALRHAGLDGRPRDWSDLSPIDQFHSRGLAATRELAEALGAGAEDSVLDVGCGLGGPARFLAATYGCRVTGIDLSGPFIDAARMLTDRTGLSDRINLLQADALDLPFDDVSFDHAWTQHVAMNIADRAALYASIRRVLKPGGRLAIHDIIAGEGGPPTYPLPWARVPEISHLLTPDAMRTALVGAGFSELSWSDHTDSALAWFTNLQAKGPSRSPLGIHVVMGPEFAGMAANLGRNLKEGRVRIVRAVYRRD